MERKEDFSYKFRFEGSSSQYFLTNADLVFIRSPRFISALKDLISSLDDHSKRYVNATHCKILKLLIRLMIQIDPSQMKKLEEINSTIRESGSNISKSNKSELQKILGLLIQSLKDRKAVDEKFETLITTVKAAKMEPSEEIFIQYFMGSPSEQLLSVLWDCGMNHYNFNRKILFVASSKTEEEFKNEFNKIWQEKLSNPDVFCCIEYHQQPPCNIQEEGFIQGCSLSGVSKYEGTIGGDSFIVTRKLSVLLLLIVLLINNCEAKFSEVDIDFALLDCKKQQHQNLIVIPEDFPVHISEEVPEFLVEGMHYQGWKNYWCDRRLSLVP